MWTVNFLMFKLVLEKAEEPEIKLPTFAGSWKKQGSSRKTSSSALLTMPKPLTVWITINCGKFWKRWEYQLYVYVYINTHLLFQILFHYSLLQDICYRIDPFCVSVLYTIVSVNPKLLIYPSPIPFPRLGNCKFLFFACESISVFLAKLFFKFLFIYLWLCWVSVTAPAFF